MCNNVTNDLHNIDDAQLEWIQSFDVNRSFSGGSSFGDTCIKRIRKKIVLFTFLRVDFHCKKSENPTN